jgi:hypothetical protein
MFHGCVYGRKLTPRVWLFGLLWISSACDSYRSTDDESCSAAEHISAVPVVAPGAHPGTITTRSPWEDPHQSRGLPRRLDES